MSSGSAELRDLTLGKELGKGGFGLVYQGTFEGSDMGIKKVQMDFLDPNKASREYKFMRKLNHSNVLQLLHWKDKEEFRFTCS